MTKSVFKITVFLLLVVVALSLPISLAGVCHAQTWGSVDTQNLWYFSENALDVLGAKEIVDGWDTSKLGDKIVIAVIDTGINVQHELFADVMLKNDDGLILGYNITQENQGGYVNISDTASSHGSNVAGVIAMLIKEFGLEDYIKIYPIKANTSTNDEFKIKNLALAVEHASNLGVDIINLSLGSDDSKYQKVSSADRSAFEFAIEHAKSQSLIVAAAGNNSSNSSTQAGLFYPAVFDGTIGVMGYGKDGNLYSTSNFGAAYDICAPADDIYTASEYTGGSDVSHYISKTGTSLATPMVSFASALLKLRYRAEGKGEIDATTLARMMRNLSGKVASKGDLSFRALNFANLLSQDFENTAFEYAAPTDISIMHNGTTGSGDLKDTIVRRANNLDAITFVAKLSPQGKVDPDLESAITWTLSLLDDNGDVVSTAQIGKGARLEWTQSRGGDFVLTAKLALYDIETSVDIHIEYAPYYVGEVRVALLDDVSKGVDGARSKGVLFVGKKTKFALTGMQFVNPDVETKWFVNGEYVASGSVFEFKPKWAGTYEITAQYGDNAKVDFGYKFTAKVLPAIIGPIGLPLVLIALASAIGVAVGVVKSKKKKQAVVSAEEDIKE